MRAREWVLADRYRAPADYGIPRLPAWEVTRSPCGRLRFAAADGDPFISAAAPVPVRR